MSSHLQFHATGYGHAQGPDIPCEINELARVHIA